MPIYGEKPPESNEGVKCEAQSIGINSEILNEAWQREIHVEWKARRRLSLSLNQGHEGRIHEVLQEDGCSSMYNS
jgi:hypothetical protein